MKFLREPLVHFLLIGAVLYGIFSALGKATGIAPAGTIVITPNLVDNLKLSYVRSAGATPSPLVLDQLVQDYIREEIFSREGSARGLEQDDPIIRRELQSRMESFYEDSAQAPSPADDQLQNYLEKHAKEFLQPDGRPANLASVRQQVQDAWTQAQRKEALDAAYQKLRARYTVDRVTLQPASSHP